MTKMRGPARIGVALALAVPACAPARQSPAPAPEDPAPVVMQPGDAALDELLKSGRVELLEAATVGVVMSEGMPVACPRSVPFMPVVPVDSSGDRGMNAGPVKPSPCPPLAQRGSMAGAPSADSTAFVRFPNGSRVWFYPADTAKARGKR
ncbi:MAG TPA: hypothetical protein VF746_16780 [Longimicrobium sp.]|jgi:hypothetical protein